MVLAGRGWGKTRTGAQDIAFYGLTKPNTRIAIVTPTFGDARDTCVEGVSGLLSVIQPELIENWNISIVIFSTLPALLLGPGQLLSRQE